ncbi:hypothetical protein IJH06_00495 [Candidatus Saccharibacteria bacterium]|nr:hypothetical protein [Candidatus Saccharibacteria bacterium]
MPTKKLLDVFNLPVMRQKILGEQYSNKLSYDELVNAESEYGRTIFGPIPEGHRREFFMHRSNVWVWHESWKNKNGLAQDVTIRYEVRPDGVYKKPQGGTYERLGGRELDNFVNAAKMYYELVKEKMYS